MAGLVFAKTLEEEFTGSMSFQQRTDGGEGRGYLGKDHSRQRWQPFAKPWVVSEGDKKPSDSPGEPEQR